MAPEDDGMPGGPGMAGDGGWSEDDGFDASRLEQYRHDLKLVRRQAQKPKGPWRINRVRESLEVRVRIGHCA